MKCWDCDGKGSKLVHSLWSGCDKEGKRVHGGGERDMSCDRCKGSGKVPEEMREWVKRGERLREKRIGTNISMREMANKLGCRGLGSLGKIIPDAESGKVDPREVEEKFDDWMYFQNL